MSTPIASITVEIISLTGLSSLKISSKISSFSSFVVLACTIFTLYRFPVGNACLRGKGVPWVQIMENEFEYLADRGGHGGHSGKKFVKKYCS